MLSSSDYKHANEIYKYNNGNVLWLGDFSAADDTDWIKQKNIRTVITAAHGLTIQYGSSVRHYTYTLEDKKTQNMIQYFDEAGSKIEKGLKFGSVLVHCAAGVSRSATFVIAYLMKYQSKSFHQALKQTRQKRPVICPNLGFQLQLKKYTPKSNYNIYEPDVTEGFPKSNKKLFSSLYTSSNKTSKIQSFPQILKPRNFEFSGASSKSKPKGWRDGKIGEKKFMAKSLVSKNADSESTILKNQIRKIAQFRFGMTNTTKWGFY